MKAKNSDAMALLKDLVAIPSYVNQTTNELEIMRYLEQFLKKQLPEMTLEKQSFDGPERYNLLVRGKETPKLFVLGHADTVLPQDSWQTNPLEAVIKNGKLYGLGSADMKGSLAAFLCAVIQNKDQISLDDLGILIYGDEEYDFKGLKQFLRSDYAANLSPELILSLDGRMVLSTGCRGLIEIIATIRGVSGHSSNPSNGANVITGTVEALKALDQELSTYQDEALGRTTTNLAYLRGGTVQGSGQDLLWQREGNIIPDHADITIEIRPSVLKVDAKFVLSTAERLLAQKGLSIQSFVTRHNIKPWPVNYASPAVPRLLKAAKRASVELKRADRTLSSYVDVQMLAEKVNAPVFVVGIDGQYYHTANEYITPDDLYKATKLYSEIVKEYLI